MEIDTTTLNYKEADSVQKVKGTQCRKQDTTQVGRKGILQMSLCSWPEEPPVQIWIEWQEAKTERLPVTFDSMENNIKRDSIILSKSLGRTKPMYSKY